MELTLETLNKAFQPLKRIVAKDLPAPMAWRLARTAAQIETELKILNERHTALVTQYADDTGTIKEEQTDAFQSEWKALLAETIQLDIKPIEITQIPPHVSLKPADLMLLDFLFTEEKNHA